MAHPAILHCLQVKEPLRRSSRAARTRTSNGSATTSQETSSRPPSERSPERRLAEFRSSERRWRLPPDSSSVMNWKMFKSFPRVETRTRMIRKRWDFLLKFLFFKFSFLLEKKKNMVHHGTSAVIKLSLKCSFSLKNVFVVTDKKELKNKSP